MILLLFRQARGDRRLVALRRHTFCLRKERRRWSAMALALQRFSPCLLPGAQLSPDKVRQLTDRIEILYYDLGHLDFDAELRFDKCDQLH